LAASSILTIFFVTKTEVIAVKTSVFVTKKMVSTQVAMVVGFTPGVPFTERMVFVSFVGVFAMETGVSSFLPMVSINETMRSHFESSVFAKETPVA